jgi:hypothetical protein
VNHSTTVESPEISFVSLPDGQSVEVEFDLDESAIEIRHVEPCGAIAGSVFIPFDRIEDLIKTVRRAIPRSRTLLAGF